MLEIFEIFVSSEYSKIFLIVLLIMDIFSHSNDK